MTRHSKNSESRSFYSHHEKGRDSKAAKWGLQSARLGKVRAVLGCARFVTLAGCAAQLGRVLHHAASSDRPRDNVRGHGGGEGVMVWNRPDGFLYEKEAIYEYLLNARSEIKRKTQLWEAQQERERVCCSWWEVLGCVLTDAG